MRVRLTGYLIDLLSEKMLKFEQAIHKLHLSNFITFQY